MQYSGDNGRAWPRIETLAVEVGLGARQVQKCLRKLEDNGLIKRHDSLGGRHRSSVFLFPWNALYEKTPNESSPFWTEKGELQFGVSAGNGEPEFVVSPQKGEPQFVVSDERVNCDAQKGELSCSETVNCSSPRINSLEAIQEASERAESSTLPPPPTRPAQSEPPGSSLTVPVSEPKAKEPQAEAEKPVGVASVEVDAVIAALDECGVKVPETRIAAELIQLAADRDVSVPGLIAFIRDKARSRHVEVATFFRRAIPEDLRQWAARQTSRDPWRRPDREAELRFPAPAPACPRCEDRGTLQDSGGTQTPALIRFCDCDAGNQARDAHELVYSVSQAACTRCLSTLRVQVRTGGESARFAVCAFCDPPPAWDHAESPGQAASRLAAAVPAPRCEVCEWDGVVARNTGLVKTEWGTEQSAASYCSCKWGEYARSTNRPDYLDRISQTERDIARREREWREGRSRLQTRPIVRTMPAPAALSGTAAETASPKCPECGMKPGTGFKVSETDGTRTMEPCTCTSPELAAEICKAAERTRQHRQTELFGSLDRIPALTATAASPTLMRALA